MMTPHPDPRPPAVAGTFYPGHAPLLLKMVDGMLAEAAGVACRPRPKALVVPHAGYVYSGPVAASAYIQLRPMARALTRVVMVGPAHRVAVSGLVSPGVHGMSTPLGTMEVDVEALADVGAIRAHPRAHAQEHSLEVQLPFLQRVTPEVSLVPLLAGDAAPEEVAEVLEALWGGPETLILISSDLSHYLPYAQARQVDRQTADRVLSLSAKPLDGEDACGCVGLNGLLCVARRRGMSVELLDLRTSGDTAGSKDQVVGYGAFAFHEA